MQKRILALATVIFVCGSTWATQSAKRTRASGESARLPGTAIAAMQKIDPERIRAHVRFLSSDLLEGRGTGQRGGDIASEYIATQFALDGLQPGGEKNSYFQDVPMMGVKTQAETSFKLVPANGEALTLKNLDDFVTSNES